MTGSPAGRPSDVNPHGTDATDCPVRLQIIVNGVHHVGRTSLPSMSEEGSPMGKAAEGRPLPWNSFR